MSERRAGKPGIAPVLWTSLALFAILFAFLTYQLVAGNDPSGASVGTAAARPVLVRRVVKRRVVTTVVPGPGPSTAAAAPASTSAAPVPSPNTAAPVVTAAS